jgi:hypothetical protein
VTTTAGDRVPIAAQNIEATLRQLDTFLALLAPEVSEVRARDFSHWHPSCGTEYDRSHHHH